MHIRSTLGATLALLLLTQSPSAEETITLGAALSLTGKYSTDGEDTKNGYDLAVKTINAAGGVLVGEQSHDIVIKYYDDESLPQRGADLVERLISQDGIQYILGPFSPEMISAVAPIIEKYKVPMLLGNSATQSLFTAGNQYIFTVLTSVQKYLSSALKMAADRAGQSGGKLADMKVAAAFESDLFSQAVRTGVLKGVQDLGMQVVIDDKFPAEFDDMATTLRRVKTMKPDILLVSGHASGAATAIRQIAEMKVDVPMLALTHCDDANIIKKFGDLAAYTLCASQWTPTVSYRDDIFGSAADYAKLFEKTYNYTPPFEVAGLSAAVMAFAQAFTNAGSLEPQMVRDALAALDIETFFGAIKFDANGNNIAKPMVLYQVLDGRYKVVAPAATAEATLVFPRPDWSRR